MCEQPARSATATRSLGFMRAAWLRYAGDGIAGNLSAFRARHVAEGNDAHEALLAVHYRQAPHADVAHVLRDMVEILVVVAVMDVLAHHLAHRRVGTLAL